MLRGRVKDMFKSYRSPDNNAEKKTPPPPQDGAAPTPPLSASPPLQQTRQQQSMQQHEQQKHHHQQVNYDVQDEQVRLATELAMAAKQNPHITPEELRRIQNRQQQQQQPNLLDDTGITSPQMATLTPPQVPQQQQQTPPSDDNANWMTTSVDDFLMNNNPQQQQQQQQQHPNPHGDHNDDDNEDYVSESLASFVKQANSMLEETQQTFWQEMEQDTTTTTSAGGSWEEKDQDPSTSSPRHVEDDHDRQIKGDMLHRLDRRKNTKKTTAAAAAEPILGSPDAPIPVMDKEEDILLATTPAMQQQHVNTSANTNSNNNHKTDDTFLWSPDLLISPPPNPVHSMTESQIKREAVGGGIMTDSNNTPPPPPPSYEAATQNAAVPRRQQQQETETTSMEFAVTAQPTNNMDLEFAIPPAPDEQQEEEEVDLMQLDETGAPQSSPPSSPVHEQPGTDLLNLLSDQPEMEFQFEQQEPDLIPEATRETNEEEEEPDLFHLHDEPTPQSAAVDSELLHLESPSQEPAIEMNFDYFSPSPVAATAASSQTPAGESGSISQTMPAGSQVKTSPALKSSPVLAKTPGSAPRTASASSASTNSSSQVKTTPAATTRSRLAAGWSATSASSSNRARGTPVYRTTPSSASSSVRAKTTPASATPASGSSSKVKDTPKPAIQTTPAPLTSSASASKTQATSTASSKKLPGSEPRTTRNPGPRTTPSSESSSRMKQPPVSRSTPPSAQRSVASSSERSSDLYSRLSKGTAASRAHSTQRSSHKPSTASPARASPASTSRRRSPAVASRLMEGTAASRSHSAQRPSPNITKMDTELAVSSTPEAVVPVSVPAKTPSPASCFLQGTASSRAHAAQYPRPRPSPIVTSSPSMASTSRLIQGTVASRAHATPEPGPRTSPGGDSIPSVSPTSRLMKDTAASKAHVSPHSVPSSVNKSIPAVPEGSHLMQETESSKAHATVRPSPSEAQEVAVLPKEKATTGQQDPLLTTASPEVARDATLPPRGGASAVSSRLMQGTAASQAKNRDDASQTGISRLLRGTSASQARASGSRRSTQGTAASRSRVVSEGSAKAQERVRQRKIQEKRKKQQQVATTSQRATRLTTDERVARARERVRQKELEQKAAIQRKVKKGKSLTVPRAPNLATSAKYGERMGLGRNEPTLAQSTDVLRKGLRDEHAPSTRMTKPTIPHSPRFATTARCGEKATVPGPRKGYLISSAQSNDVLKQQLRQPIKSTRKRETGLTIPKTPNFHASAKRELPKSTLEKEKEMMEYFQSHPFKAKPINAQPGGTQVVVRKPAKRRLTMPAPFNLRTDVRGANATPIAAIPDPEELDLEETKKQFHARPMPNFSHPSKVQVAAARKSLSLTQPEPFHFASDRLARSARRAHENPDNMGVTKQFRARPAPKTTYEYHGPILHKSPTSSLSSEPSPRRAPDLQTLARSEQRRESLEAAKRHAEQFAQQKKLEVRQRIRSRHYEAMRQAELASPVSAASKNASPFSLQSAARHEAYQQKLEEKLREEEARRREEMEFHARSFRSTPAPPGKIHSNRGPTQPEPFALPGMRRHEMSQEEQKRKLAEMEEERRRMAGFKARPVPKTTYKYKPISPHGTGELIQPFSPELQSKQRAQERQAFDERVERERQEEEARQRAIQERFAAEEEADLQERRRLPVSEGGMIPLAEPVNAILASEHQMGIYQK